MVVTGASSGIGKALSKHFAAMGWKVCAIARRADKLKKLEEEHAGHIFSYPSDVSDAQQVKASFAAIQAAHGPVDVLINNAGIVPQDKAFGQDDFEVIAPTIDINLKGTMYCTYAVLPGMLERSDGRIINIASRAGVVGGDFRVDPEGPLGFADYGASKFGVVGFGHHMGRQLLPRGILMTTLCPGGINTPVADAWNVDKDDLMQPEQIADLIEFLLKQEKNIFFKQMLFFAGFEWH
jgi:NAD(P)-dependent dehydrogenase (short-subunit alcohol dehydrogenase family)